MPGRMVSARVALCMAGLALVVGLGAGLLIAQGGGREPAPQGEALDAQAACGRFLAAGGDLRQREAVRDSLKGANISGEAELLRVGAARWQALDGEVVVAIGGDPPAGAAPGAGINYSGRILSISHFLLPAAGQNLRTCRISISAGP
ncbi:MAG: hypothetical protein K6A65_03750 [Succinivibrionaceae bacterium]|nr:hypothetical protein [Succinivibrionaceae bacterium]